MKLCLLFLLGLFGSVFCQNCIYGSVHCASDVCPDGSTVHCLDSRCKCLTTSNAVSSQTCTQRTDCSVGACTQGKEMHCLDKHCKCLVNAESACNHDADCVAAHNNNKHCGPADDDGEWECHHNVCQCAH